MKRSDVTERILDIKREKGWKWKDICQKIGGYSEMLIVGALLGQMKLTKPQAAKAAELFGLSKSEEKMLNEVPMRGANVPMPPTDPVIYRFYELVMINGPAWKALIEEEFGDGIMSAIDFDLVTARVREFRGGIPTMTADGHHILGPAPGVEGFHFASGCNVAGLSISPAVGEALAAWIVDGKPPVDLTPMSAMRFKGKTWNEHELWRDAAWQYRHFFGAV